MFSYVWMKRNFKPGVHPQKGNASLKLLRENEFFEKEFDNSTKPDANLGNYSPPNFKSVNLWLLNFHPKNLMF